MRSAFDLKAPTFRHLAYEGYKAQRKGMPEELAAQMPVLKEVLDAMNIRRYELEGWEADDLLGTIGPGQRARRVATPSSSPETRTPSSLSTDTPPVKLVTTRMGQTTTKAMTPEAFREQYGFDPIHMIDLKALMGDASPTTSPASRASGRRPLWPCWPAVSLHRRASTPTWTSLDAKPAVLKKLTEGESDARLSYDLATIHCDAPMDFHPEDAARKGWNDSALYRHPAAAGVLQTHRQAGPVRSRGRWSRKQTAFTGACESEIVTAQARMEELLAAFRERDHVSFLALSGLRGVCVEWDEGGSGRAALFLPDRLDC